MRIEREALRVEREALKIERAAPDPRTVTIKDINSQRQA